VAITLVARDVDPATPETGDIAIVTTPAKNLKLKPGKSKSVQVKFTYPNVTAGAAYALVATVDSANGVAEGNETNNEGSSATNVTIAPAFVDLAAVSLGQLKNGTIAIGKKNSISLTVQNLGNVPATGQLKMDFYASTTPDGVIDAGDILLGSVTKKLKLKNGASKTIKVNGGVVDPSFPPGSYYITAVINNPPAIAETNAANNTVVSTTAFPAA
jgi:subtilase family serine protease